MIGPRWFAVRDKAVVLRLEQKCVRRCSLVEIILDPPSEVTSVPRTSSLTPPAGRIGRPWAGGFGS